MPLKSYIEQVLSTTSTHLYPSQLASAEVHVSGHTPGFYFLIQTPVKKKFFPAQNLFSTIMYIANIYDLTIKTDQGP